MRVVGWIPSRWRAFLVLSALVGAACTEPPADEAMRDGRLTLREEVAVRLGLPTAALPRLDSAAVPAAVQAWVVDSNRGLGEMPKPWYFDAGGGRVVALIPDDPWPGVDANRITVFDRDGRMMEMASTFQAVDHYCPPRGALGGASWTRDSVDGCRYIRRVPRDSLQQSLAGAWELHLKTGTAMQPRSVRGLVLLRDSAFDACPPDFPACVGLANGTQRLPMEELLGSGRTETVTMALEQDGRIFLMIGQCCDAGELSLVGTLKEGRATGRWFEGTLGRGRRGSFTLRRLSGMSAGTTVDAKGQIAPRS